jgi:glycosyltransferase involved in cell wall biosynthesis
VKILHVNTSDTQGGAARAAYRLHRSLLAEGIGSQMLVQSKASDDFTVVGPTTKIQKGLGKIRPTLDSFPVRHYKHRTKTLFSPAWVPFSDVVDRINELNPDVVHLHWIAGGMVRIEDVARIKAPIVWSLHDMWAFTGGCHYDEECGGFRQQCGNCKVLGSGTSKDLSRRVHGRKQATFQKKKNITLVGLSKWLADEAANSSLFSSQQVVNLPNPIDTEVFSPFNQAAARELLNLPQGKKLILFGAMGATSDPRKGYKELSQALKQLQIDDAGLVVFGASQPQGRSEFPQPAHYLGRLHDDVTLRVLYSAADVMVVPSYQEAFGQTASESMACGTPVVAFGATGLLDIVDHKENGYLAKPFEPADLAHGIEWILNHVNYNKLCENARKKVVQYFDFKVVAPQYIELYRSVLEKEIS